MLSRTNIWVAVFQRGRLVLASFGKQESRFLYCHHESTMRSRLEQFIFIASTFFLIYIYLPELKTLSNNYPHASLARVPACYSFFRCLVCRLVGMPTGWLSFGIMSTPSADAIALHKEICHAGELPLTPNVCILATGNHFTSSPITDMATKDSGSVPKAALHHLSKVNSDWVTWSCNKRSVTTGGRKTPKQTPSFDIHRLIGCLGLTC